MLVESYNDSKSKKILDYGCGTGEFLNEMNNNGYQCTGIEPSPKASEHAKNSYQLEVLNPDKLHTLQDANYDVITMWHVMEHIHDLNETISTLKQKLKSDGHLIIAVPNHSSWDAAHYQSYWAAYDVPRHLYHFTNRSVGKLLSMHGFTLNKMLPMKWDAFYVSLLSEKYKKNTFGPVAAFIAGMRSNFSGMMDINKYSSLIYIAKSTH
jgi:SAM-dependent methyltransferase